MSRRGSIPDIADSVDATRPFCLGSSAHTTISYRQVPAAVFPAAARAFGGNCCLVLLPPSNVRSAQRETTVPLGLQTLQSGRAGQRGMAGCGPGRCAVTLTAASRICSAAVLAWPVRRAKRLRASRHAVEDHGQVTGEDFRGPPQPRADWHGLIMIAAAHKRRGRCGCGRRDRSGRSPRFMPLGCLSCWPGLPGPAGLPGPGGLGHRGWPAGRRFRPRTTRRQATARR